MPGSFTELLCEFLELKRLSDNSGDDGTYFTVRDDRFFGCDKMFSERLSALEDEINKRVDGL